MSAPNSGPVNVADLFFVFHDDQVKDKKSDAAGFNSVNNPTPEENWVVKAFSLPDVRPRLDGYGRAIGQKDGMGWSVKKWGKFRTVQVRNSTVYIESLDRVDGPDWMYDFVF